ncbi:hypothetical protein RND71_039543 [Anisodus tanguticus]|uniref:Uncharacterized protein n=1 Tax=Anisodus tanguticus TaxID=243964 RepID=A0AAE1QZS2_9SOLA|nr:hypothetical protein RND71_039543 [Anisodus tanguticus]
MGACASKPNVLNGEAPEVALENIPCKDVGVVVQEEVNKEDDVIVDHDDADKIPSLSNLINNEEGKGSVEEKEEISVKASDVASEAKMEVEVEKVVDDDMKIDATTCIDDKKIEEVKSETSIENNVEEVLTPSEERENKTDDQEKLPTAIEEAPEEKTVEEVKLAEKPTIEDKKIEEKPTVVEDPNSEALEKKKTEEKPTTTKKSMFCLSKARYVGAWKLLAESGAINYTSITAERNRNACVPLSELQLITIFSTEVR